MTLVDTSIWIETFRKREPLRLEDVVTCFPVLREVLRGFRAKTAYRIARDAMLALPVVESPMGESLFVEAADRYRSARRRGLTVRSSTDCLIAACALRHDLAVLHGDRDYGILARVSALRASSP